MASKRSKFILARFIPSDPVVCRYACVYAERGICDNPNLNKGNSDAVCHRMSNVSLLDYLKSINASLRR